MSRIFISYRRQDSEGYVGRLYDHLTQHFEREDIFMDVDSIKPGQDFVQVLEDAVAACDVLIAVIGPHWIDVTDENGERRLEQWNDFVRIELAAALEKGKTVIPVLVQKGRMPTPNELPDNLKGLARRNALELTHERFSYDIGKLVESILPILKPPIDEVVQLKTEIRSAVNRAVVKSGTWTQKEAAMKAFREKLLNLTESPAYQYRIQNNYSPVPGEGNLDAKIMFIGEAPGQNEAETGRPFCGPSGDILDELLKGIRLRREDVFLTNIVLDRLPANRSPIRSEIDFYAPLLDEQLEIVQPLVIAPLGRFSMEYILRKYDLPEKRETITKLHGKLLQAAAPYGALAILPLYHPAVVLYTPSMKEILRQDFEKLRLFI